MEEGLEMQDSKLESDHTKAHKENVNGEEKRGLPLLRAPVGAMFYVQSVLNLKVKKQMLL